MFTSLAFSNCNNNMEYLQKQFKNQTQVLWGMNLNNANIFTDYTLKEKMKIRKWQYPSGSIVVEFDRSFPVFGALIR